MAVRLNPTTVREVPTAFQGVYAHAVRVENPARLLCIAGQIGVTPAGETLETFEAQCRQAMANAEAILDAEGLSRDDMVRVVYYVTDPKHLPSLLAIRQERWAGPHPPAVTTLVVAGLAAPELLVEIEVTAGR